MKSYIYTRKEKVRNHGGVYHTHYTVKLYRVIRGTPKFVGEDTSTFCSDFQQCRDLMKKLKLWPKAADAQHENGFDKYAYPYQLRDVGIININHI